MLKYAKYLILLVFMVLASGCYARFPSVGVGHDITIEVQKRPRYRYINKYVCKWRHGHRHCHSVRIKVRVR